MNVQGDGIGGYQRVAIILCGLAVLVDGINFQIIGYVAPAILKEWRVSAASLGPVFASAMFGMVLGSTMLGSLADSIGRRPVIIVSLFAFSAFTLLTTQAHTVSQLLWLRFATGFGLGAIMPNATALASEYSPRRLRIVIVTAVSSAFPMGAAVGGLLAAYLVPTYGWRSVFFVGAACPAVAGLVLSVKLPESIHYLERKGRTGRHREIVRRLGRHVGFLDLGAPTAAPAKGVRVRRLFADGRTASTLLLWSTSFLNLLTLFVLSSWLPTILSAAGQPITSAVLAGVVLQVGGCTGAILIARRINKAGSNSILAPIFLLAAISLGVLGQPGLPLWLIFTIVAVSGVTVVGSQQALNALAATLYPSDLRGTGVGWAQAVARTGAIIGPVAVGELIALHIPNDRLFLILAAPSLISAGLVLVFIAGRGRLSSRQREEQLGV